jgi:hypothetical protein
MTPGAARAGTIVIAMSTTTRIITISARLNLATLLSLSVDCRN